MNYYNEFEPKAAAWLRELIKAGLIPDGVVDERSITEIKPHELSEFTQCHFFAGISGWSLALQLAEWPADRSVWSGSCPCQPFSSAGKQKGVNDERHLWPVFFDLIRQCRPPVVFGEQVASAPIVGASKPSKRSVEQVIGATGGESEKEIILCWLDGISTDLEGEGYACGAVVLGAHSVGAPHQRQRLYWVADSNSGRFRQCDAGQRAVSISGAVSATDAMADTDGERRDGERIRLLKGRSHETSSEIAWSGATSPLGNAEGRQQRWPRQSGESDGWEMQAGGSGAWSGDAAGTVEHPDGSAMEPEQETGRSGNATAWSDFEIIGCADGKARRVKSGLQCLAHGVPGRVAQLRGLGNAIVPQVAAEFIKSFLDE